MARDENVRIFQDTEKRVKEDPGLQEAVERSVAEQVLIPEMMEVTDLMPELAQTDMSRMRKLSCRKSEAMKRLRDIRENGCVCTILPQRRIPEVVWPRGALHRRNVCAVVLRCISA